MRYLTIACLLSAVAATPLTACGGEQSSSASTQTRPASHRSAGSATPVSRDPVRTPAPPTRADALALGRAINLTAGDIPGASISRKKQRSSEAAERPRCEGSIGRGPNIAEVQSPRLTRGSELETEEFRSSVTVRPDARAAARDLAWLRRPGAAQCIAHTLSRRFGGRTIREAHWGAFRVSPLSTQVPGAARTIGLRITTTLSFPVTEISVPIYLDLLLFASGPAEIGMWGMSATQPVPAATEQRLLSLLLDRAQAHAL
jgi:hypothetical protein